MDKRLAPVKEKFEHLVVCHRISDEIPLTSGRAYAIDIKLLTAG
jgi:hypothetical protein